MENSRISFWITFPVILIGLCAAFAVGVPVWSNNFTIQLIAWALVSLIAVGYLVWRIIFKRVDLVKTRLEWVFGVFVVAVIISWLISPDMRQGLERLGILLGYLILFYLLVDAYDAGLHRGAALLAVLVLSGIVVLLTGLETYAAYTGWWEQVGTRSILPPFPYRYVSLMGHANAFMGFANLCAPLAFVAFIQCRSIVERVGAGVWLVFYLFTIPFSSSLGGWLGFTVWVVIFSLIWLWEHDVWQHLKVWYSVRLARRVITIGFLLGVLGVTFMGGHRFWQYFSAHTMHASGLFGSRGEIWLNSLEIWKTNILFGAGPGRFAIEYLNTATSIPRSNWAGHAHSSIFQFLAEFGILGLLSWVLLLAAGSWRFWKSYRRSSPALRVWNRAILAGGASWAVHGLFDELITLPVMSFFLLLLAWLMTAGEKKVERWRGLHMAILGLPVFMLIVGIGWNLWALSPTVEAFSSDNGPRARAELIEYSLHRDNKLAFYHTQAGFVRAVVWLESGENLTLVMARDHFRQSLELEPKPSLYWADLGILDWYAGNREAAIDHMMYASSLSPKEPSYWLNLGWLFESMREPEEAERHYLTALGLAPGWAEHPFWSLSTFRETVLSSWKADNPNWNSGEAEYWKQAQTAVDTDDLERARLLLAFSSWVSEPVAARWVVEGQMAEAEGDIQAAVRIYEALAEEISKPNLRIATDFAKGINSVYWRPGWEGDLVPGYLQLDQDYGQFDALEHLQELYVVQGNCQDAERINGILYGEIRGGALDVEPAHLDCPH